jgi:hypothetical protein
MPIPKFNMSLKLIASFEQETVENLFYENQLSIITITFKIKKTRSDNGSPVILHL